MLLHRLGFLRAAPLVTALLGSVALVLGGAGCFEDKEPTSGSGANLTGGGGPLPPSGADCYFDCSRWDSSTFGPGARAPKVFQKALREGNVYIGAPGHESGGVCVPNALPEKVKPFVTAAPPFPGAMREPGSEGSNPDEGVESKEFAASDQAITGSFRYACMADGYILDRSKASRPDEKDVQSFFEDECISAGACPSVDINSDAALRSPPAPPTGGPSGPDGSPTDHERRDSCAGKADGVYCSELTPIGAYVCQSETIASGQQCAPAQRCIGPNGPGDTIQCSDDMGQGGGSPGSGDGAGQNLATRFDPEFVDHYVSTSKHAQPRGGSHVGVRDWDPNEHAPVGWLGRRIVAHIAEGPCTAFRGVDTLVRRLNNRWALYASYGASGGAGGALKFSAAYAYDMTAYESAAYVDAGVNIGFNASIGLSAARGITIGGDAANYDSIHNFYGGGYAGVNGNVSTPFARVGVGMQISSCVPSLHPWTLELSVSFGIGATPFEANATTGAIIPINLGTRRLRGITGGWINVFDDEYGAAPFGGIGNNFGGDYERMRNSPNSSAIWKAGSFANSAVRFANAHDLAAVFIFRAAFDYAWAQMRAVCN